MKFSIYEKLYEKPGPGVGEDEPKKKGARRFLELLFHNCASLIKCNLLVIASMLPAFILFVFVLSGAGGVSFWLTLVLIALVSIPVGPAMTAANYLITKMLREEPGFFFFDFKKAFREGFKQTALVGALYMVLLALQLYLLFSENMMGAEVASLAGLLLSSVLFHMVCPYYFLQAACMSLNPGALLKNSLLLAFSKLPRSFMSALCLMACFLLFALYAPFLLPLLALFGYAVPTLMSLMWIWPPVNETFEIEKRLQEQKTG
ncbi:DUF624 domain-containing protein [Christensenellaceae bacterium OttesenSCG-928-M15]|nr:DUF624 domain-containing protein [Christensenellaceae bacterium OttesenSCG-928-M15]